MSARPAMRCVALLFATAIATPCIAIGKPHPPLARAASTVDPYVGLTPSEAVAMHWEEEAIRQGRIVCSNPNHHHAMAPQTHWLLEGGD